MDHAAYAQKLCEDVRSVLDRRDHVKVDSVELRQILAPTPAGSEWVVKLRVVSTAYVNREVTVGLILNRLTERDHETLWISIEWTE
jgi:hypothetical protein